MLIFFYKFSFVVLVTSYIVFVSVAIVVSVNETCIAGDSNMGWQ